MSIAPYPSHYTAQPLDLTLTALAELPTAPNTAPYFTGLDQAALMSVTPFIRTLLDDPDLASAQATLGIGAAAPPTGGANTVAVFDAAGALTSDAELSYNATTNILTGSRLAIGGHASTGVLDVQTSVVASDLSNTYLGMRLWPVAPSGASTVFGVRLEATTGAALADAAVYGVAILDQPGAYSAYGLYSYIASGTNRYNINAGGTAQNYFNGNVGIKNNAPSYPLDVTGQVRASALTLGGHAPTGVLDVQTSISDGGSNYNGLRVWPVAPAGATTVNPVRLEATTGAAAASAQYLGIVVTNPPVTTSNTFGLYLDVASGANRWNIFASGTAQNYFAGNVGIANAAPSYPLDVTGQARITGSMALGGAVTAAVQLQINWDKVNKYGLVLQPSNNDAGSGNPVTFMNISGAAVGSISTSATNTSYNTSSDVRLKTNILDLTDGIDVIERLHPVSFNWKATGEQGHGFLANEVQVVVPEATTGEPDAVDESGNILPMQMDNAKLVPYLTAALQEVIARVKNLEALCMPLR